MNNSDTLVEFAKCEKFIRFKDCQILGSFLEFEVENTLNLKIKDEIKLSLNRDYGDGTVEYLCEVVEITNNNIKIFVRKIIDREGELTPPKITE